VVRDFRTVDVATLLADLHRAHNIGRTTLKHFKSFLSGVFTYAKNQGVIDGVNPIHGAMIPKKASAARETHAATLDEVLAIMDALDKVGERKACAAVALMFFAGLRPGEARGPCWEDFDGKRLIVRQPATEGTAEGADSLDEGKRKYRLLGRPLCKDSAKNLGGSRRNRLKRLG
jgi:integrase